MNVLDQAYAILSEHGLCRSQREFSRKYLGMSAGYWGYIKATGNQPGRLALMNLHHRLANVPLLALVEVRAAALAEVT